jgi:hypothetical protein
MVREEEMDDDHYGKYLGCMRQHRLIVESSLPNPPLPSSEQDAHQNLQA